MWQNVGYSLPAIQAELGTDEQVLWNGQPQSGIRLRPADALFIPISLVWCGMALFVAGDVLRSGNDPAGMAFMAFFLVFGLYFLLGRFVVDAWMRGRTWYAVTNQRILIVTEAFGRKVRTLNLRSLPETTLRENKDGSGDITFGQPGPYEMWAGMQWPGASAGQTARFEMLPEVRSVFQLIQDAQRKA